MVKETDFREDETEIKDVDSHDVAVKLLYIGVEPCYQKRFAKRDVLGLRLYQKDWS